jgi:hypothetical protein
LITAKLNCLRTARYAIQITLAMRITQWLQRPAADFIYAAQPAAPGGSGSPPAHCGER